jgi:hypothetical protein
MGIHMAALTMELTYADLVRDAQGRAVLQAIEALAAAKAQRLVGLDADHVEVTGMGAITCEVNLSAHDEDDNIRMEAN